ncbi:hypothetical protein ACETU7_10700 [Rhodococcus sp. 3Y1]
MSRADELQARSRVGTAAVAEANKTPQHLGWDSSLEELLRPDLAGRTTRGLGIQFTTRTKGASTRLIIKPVQPGARGWISGGLAWNKLGSTFSSPQITSGFYATYISSTAPATITEIRMQRRSILPGFEPATLVAS